MKTNNVHFDIDPTDLDCIDSAISLLLCNPRIKKRLFERIRYNISSPGKVFFEALVEFTQNHEEPYDIAHLFRTIHQLEQEVAYLSHQLVNYDSMITKYDKLAIKVDYLKRQNQRLSLRNKDLVHAMHCSKNYR